MLVVDTANGEARLALDMISRLKHDSAFDGVQIIGGNVGTRSGAQAMIEAGADAVKVGIGPGSICTTRIVAGVGVPQLTAVYEAAQAWTCSWSTPPTVRPVWPWHGLSVPWPRHDRYFVPEGVEGEVPYRGPLNAVLYQMLGGLHQSMFYIGAHNIAEMPERGKFIRITDAGLRESHPHDIVMTTEAPNYSGFHNN